MEAVEGSVTSSTTQIILLKKFVLLHTHALSNININDVNCKISQHIKINQRINHAAATLYLICDGCFSPSG